jgi:hypothetical protein
MSSPTQLSLRRLRRQGALIVAVCESWIPHANLRRDLFGFADLAAFMIDRPGTLFVQTTTAGHLANRLRKLQSLAAVEACLRCGNRSEVHGWRKVGSRWQVRVVELRAEDMKPVVVEQPARQPRRSPWKPAELFSEVS